MTCQDGGVAVFYQANGKHAIYPVTGALHKSSNKFFSLPRVIFANYTPPGVIRRAGMTMIKLAHRKCMHISN